MGDVNRVGPCEEAPRGMKVLLFALLMLAIPDVVLGQRPTGADSTQDSTIVLRPIEISVTRQAGSLYRIPFAVTEIDRTELRRGRMNTRRCA